MRTSDMIKSNYIRAKDVKEAGAMILTIIDCTLESIGTDEKYVLWFNEHPKGLSLNTSKIRVLEASFGEDSEMWNGRRVKLTYDPTVMFGPNVVGGIKLTCSTAGRLTPGAAVAPPGAPPPPVWNGKEWVVQAPPAAARPPPPVWNPTSGQWETVNPSTGEIAPPAHQRAKTISERVEADFPAEGPAVASGTAAARGEFQDYENLPPPKAAAGVDPEFDDDIPF